MILVSPVLNCEKQIRGIVYGIGRHQPGIGELGNDVPSNACSTRLLPVEGLLNRVIVTKVDGGNSFSAALDLNGNLYTWGYNYYGQLGDGTTTSREQLMPRVQDTLGGTTIIPIWVTRRQLHHEHNQLPKQLMKTMFELHIPSRMEEH